jgi:hypothetical protein
MDRFYAMAGKEIVFFCFFRSFIYNNLNKTKLEEDMVPRYPVKHH